MTAESHADRVRALIAEVPDFPEPGIGFKDITSLLADPVGMQHAQRALLDLLPERPFDGFIAIESRGFIFAAPLAAELGVPMLLARKPGKLPRAVERVEYALEYGTDTIEMHREDVRAGARYVLVDDLIATGGTAIATVDVVTALGAEVVAAVFLIRLAFLDGAQRLSARLDGPVEAVVSYP